MFKRMRARSSFNDSNISVRYTTNVKIIHGTSKMLNRTSIWILYLVVVILVFLAALYLLKWSTATSLFVAFAAGILAVFLAPKQVGGLGDTASYSILAGVASFLLVASFVWVLIAPQSFLTQFPAERIVIVQ